MTQPQNDNLYEITITLDDREMRILQRLAEQMNTSSQQAARDIIGQRLERLTRQGPGLTMAKLQQAVAESALNGIVAPDDTWDESMIDEDLVWERDHNGERLIDRVYFKVPSGPNLPYHQATFQQDSEEPHHWRAWLEPYDIYLGELGDLQEDCFPHASVREAADALAVAYRERHPAD